MQVVTVYQQDGVIMGIPASEMRGAGQYIIKGGHVVGFKPISAPIVPEEEDEGPPLFPILTTVADTATTTIEATGNDASGAQVSETIVSDLSRAPINGG